MATIKMIGLRKLRAALAAAEKAISRGLTASGYDPESLEPVGLSEAGLEFARRRAEIQDAIRRAFEARPAFGIHVMEAGAVIDSRRFTVEEICRMFGVSVEEVQAMDEEMKAARLAAADPAAEWVRVRAIAPFEIAEILNQWARAYSGEAVCLTAQMDRERNAVYRATNGPPWPLVGEELDIFAGRLTAGIFALLTII